MAHDLRLGQTGQANLAVPAQTAQALLIVRDAGNVHSAAIVLALLEDQGFFHAMAVGCDWGISVSRTGRPALLVHDNSFNNFTKVSISQGWLSSVTATSSRLSNSG